MTLWRSANLVLYLLAVVSAIWGLRIILSRRRIDSTSGRLRHPPAFGVAFLFIATGASLFAATATPTAVTPWSLLGLALGFIGMVVAAIAGSRQR